VATLTDVLAWVGAVTGTIGFGWDVYKWRKRGAEVRVRIKPNMLHAGPRSEAQKPLCIVEAINLGAAPTTITHFMGAHYTSFWQRLLNRPAASLFVPQSSETATGVPYVLAPGQVWIGRADQAQLDEYCAKGRVKLGVAHTWQEKPVMGWVPKRAAPKRIATASDP